MSTPTNAPPGMLSLVHKDKIYYCNKGKAVNAVPSTSVHRRHPAQELSRDSVQSNNKLVRPRWPYDMRPSVRAEKYMCVIVIR